MGKILDKFEETILVISLSAMLFITVGNVLSRKILAQSWSFTEELTIALFILSSLTGAAVSAKNGKLIGLTLIFDLAPKRFQKIFTLSLLLAAVFFGGLLSYYGIDMVRMEVLSRQTTPSMGIPEWIFGLTIPFGAVLLLIRMTQYCIRQLRTPIPSKTRDDA
ncbi:hypothetical protein AGMMS50276_04510 [Synergistales bacterium]|nr:hypothetical protein AGMMS50276_04510 [Synergistales bacterium]